MEKVAPIEKSNANALRRNICYNMPGKEKETKGHFGIVTTSTPIPTAFLLFSFEMKKAVSSASDGLPTDALRLPNYPYFIWTTTCIHLHFS